jgi:hypothetical protein
MARIFWRTRKAPKSAYGCAHLAHWMSQRDMRCTAALLDPKGGGASPKPLAHSARRAGVAKQPVSAPLCLLGHCGGRYRYAPSQRKRRSARLRSLTVGEDGCRSEATQCRVGPDERHYMEVVAGRSDPRKGKRRGQKGPAQKAGPEGVLYAGAQPMQVRETLSPRPPGRRPGAKRSAQGRGDRMRSGGVGEWASNPGERPARRRRATPEAGSCWRTQRGGLQGRCCHSSDNQAPIATGTWQRSRGRGARESGRRVGLARLTRRRRASAGTARTARQDEEGPVTLGHSGTSKEHSIRARDPQSTYGRGR